MLTSNPPFLQRLYILHKPNHFLQYSIVYVLWVTSRRYLCGVLSLEYIYLYRPALWFHVSKRPFLRVHFSRKCIVIIYMFDDILMCLNGEHIWNIFFDLYVVKETAITYYMLRLKPLPECAIYVLRVVSYCVGCFVLANMDSVCFAATGGARDVK